MTMPTLSPETEFVLLVEADDLVPCDGFLRDTCDERATWSIRCSGCGVVTLYGDSCHLHFLTKMALLGPPFCRDCKTPCPRPAPFLPL